MITKASIENLKNHLDVVDVISQFIEVKKSGANFKACCPFHGEKTPSFVISPAKQIYHCFGCGAGGDAIKFLMEYEKLTYPETIEKLASMYSVSLDYDNANSKKVDIKILDSLNNYYQKLFTSKNEAKEYIKSRGISEFSIEKFEIGYAPSSNDTVEFLNKNFFNINEAKELGAVDFGSNGVYARFIERITFPIYSLNGSIVGFGGRTISGHSAKYINSPQTKLFNKSRLLYGYNLAKESIYKKKEIIVCEGYLDVIMLHQAGFNNSVATLGTALTSDHLPLLRRGEPKIILAYDGDNAGLNAAYKASLILSEGNFEGGVVVFEKGIDPADMVKSGKVQELNQMFDNSKQFTPFVIDFIISKYDIKDPQNKQKAVQEINEFLSTLKPIFQDEYKSYIASRLNINEKHIQTKKQKLQKQNGNSIEKIDIAELCIIKSLIGNQKRVDMALNIIDSSMFEYHKLEFELLLNDFEDQRLAGVLLNEKLEIYDDERLNSEIRVLLIKYYEKKLMSVRFDTNLQHQEKKNLILKIRDNIIQLKKGRLVAFSL